MANQEDTFGQNVIPFKSEIPKHREEWLLPNHYQHQFQISLIKCPLTVLIPHQRKIMLSLKDIIKTGDTSSFHYWNI